MTNDDSVSNIDDDVLSEIYAEWEEHHARGDELNLEDLCAARRRPDLLPRLEQDVAEQLRFERAFGIGTREPDPPAEAFPLPKDAISGYDVVRLLAEGGLGKVYEARDRTLDRRVALKFLKGGKARAPDLKRRFLAEARMTGSLDDPGVVPVYAVGESADGQPYYAMRLIEGRTFAEQVMEFHDGDRPGRAGDERSLAFRQLLNAFISACNTVAAAHGRGVIHCDLKPSNIMVGRYGRVTVVDWGLTRDVSPTDSTGADAEAGISEQDTRQGKWMGTTGYASPEQAAGRWKDVSPVSDVYSLGATLYEVVTGRVPPRLPDGELAAVPSAGTRRGGLAAAAPHVTFSRTAPARARWARRAAHQGPPPLPQPPLQAVVRKAMALRPQDRYPDVAALAAEVERCLADEPISAEREPALKRAARWGRRNRRTSVALVAAAAALALGAGLLREQRRLDAARQQAERKLIESELLMAAGEFDRARVALTEARGRLGPAPGERPWILERLLVWFAPGETAGRDVLRRRLERVDAEADARSRLAAFFSAADRAEFNILGDYWALLPFEEIGGRRRIANPGERAADLAAGAKLRRDALTRVGAADGRDPFDALGTGGLAPNEVARVGARAGEIVFLLALAVERLGQAEPVTTQQAMRREALVLLDRAEKLGVRGRSLALFRADFRERLGEVDAAAALRRTAMTLAPESFLDLHFQAVAHARAQRWADAVSEYQTVLALRPNEYWTLFRMAKALENNKLHAQAESLYRACLSLRPDDPTLRNSLGTLLSNLKRWDQAITQFEAVIRLTPSYLMAYTNLMLVHAERGDVTRAENVHRQLLGRNPDPATQALALNHLGLAHERAGHHKEALEYYSQAVRSDPKVAQALRNRAIAWLHVDRFDEAERDLKAAIALEPDNGDLRYVLGNVYGNGNRPADAVAAYSEALRKSPKLMDARYNRGVILRQLRRYDEALIDQAEVLGALRQNPLALTEVALSHASKGQFRLAFNAVEEILTRDDRNAAALRLRGKLLGSLGKYRDGIGPDDDLAQSEADLTRSIGLEPKNPDGYRSRGLTRMRSKRFNDAIADWRHYLELVPKARDAADIANDLSVAYLELGQVKQAAEALGDAKAAGNRPSYAANLGNIRLKEGDLTGAVAELDRAIAADPKYARAWGLRGQVRLRQGRFPEAAADIGRSLELEPHFYEVLALRATANLARGQVAAARVDLEEIIRDRADHPRGHYARGLLRLIEGKAADAVAELSRAMDDRVLRDFAVAARARAWLILGGDGLAAAAADADALVEALPRDGLARLEAARDHAMAAARGSGAAAQRRRERALDLLDDALKRQPDLRAGLAPDPDLEPLEEIAPIPGATSPDRATPEPAPLTQIE